MQSLPVYKIDPLTDPRWMELVQRHPKASVFHTRGWLNALKQTYGYQPMAFTTSPQGANLEDGMVFCDVNSWLSGRRLVSLPFSDHCSPLVNDSETLDRLLPGLKRYFPETRWRYIEIRSTDSKLGTDESFAQSGKVWLHSLDLRSSLDGLYRNFHRDCVQRKIQRAEREGLVVEQGNSPRLLDSFYQLLLLTRRRHGLPPQPIQWFRNLLGSLGTNATFFAAFKDGRPVASILVLSHGHVLVYKYGVSNQNFANLGGTQLLLWKAIQHAKRNGFETFDMGRSEQEHPGLIAFKERWGTTGIPLFHWKCPPGQKSNSRPRWPLRAANRALGCMPDRCLTAAGRLLYKHVG